MIAQTSLAHALFREVKPEFFRLLSSPNGPLYVDALDALERAAAHHLEGLEREDAVALVEEAMEAHDAPTMEDADLLTPTLSKSDKARAVLETFRRAGWVEEEQRSDWQKLVHFHPSGQALMHLLRKLAFPEAVVFSDKLVSVCTTLAPQDDDGFITWREEPWQHVESSIAALQEGIAELRGMQGVIEHHTRQQLATTTLKENLSLLFDKFAERIGRACYAELVRARLPLRLAEARRLVDALGSNTELLEAMQAEVQRRDHSITAEMAYTRVCTRLEELADLLQSVVPVADAVDRRTAEFTRRSLARFRYLQETTSESRATVQELFEHLNRHFAGRRLVDLEEVALPELRLIDTRLVAGLESLYTPRLRRAAGEIQPLDDEISEEQQDEALRRLHAAMRDSMTVARANRFVQELLPERGASMPSGKIPLRCEEDLEDLVACLLHARTSGACYRVEVERALTDADRANFDAKLNYRLERFTLHRK